MCPAFKTTTEKLKLMLDNAKYLKDKTTRRKLQRILDEGNVIPHRIKMSVECTVVGHLTEHDKEYFRQQLHDILADIYGYYDFGDMCQDNDTMAFAKPKTCIEDLSTKLRLER